MCNVKRVLTGTGPVPALHFSHYISIPRHVGKAFTDLIGILPTSVNETNNQRTGVAYRTVPHPYRTRRSGAPHLP